MDSERHHLTPLLEPKTIAIIGASEKEGSIGALLARNMSLQCLIQDGHVQLIGDKGSVECSLRTRKVSQPRA